MPSRILLTGFKPFGDLAVNPSEELMRALDATADEWPGAEIQTAVLEVDYVLAERQFRAAIERVRPDAVLAFGVAGSTDEIRLERVAVNLDDAGRPDNGGRLRAGTRIVEAGPVAYWATLDWAALYAALAAAGLPVRYSNHAGTYLCNHLFYYGLHLIATLGLGARMGFLHVPPLPEQIGEGGRARVGMDLETLVQAARVCVRVTAGAIAPAVAR